MSEWDAQNTTDALEADAPEGEAGQPLVELKDQPVEGVSEGEHPARVAELIGQGLSEADALEQYRYECQLESDRRAGA